MEEEGEEEEEEEPPTGRVSNVSDRTQELGVQPRVYARCQKRKN